MCNGVMLGCSAPSDCTGGKVCCGSMGGGGGGGGFTLNCLTADQCMPSDAGGFTFQLCDTMHACPTGESCMTFMQGGFCVNPDAGTGMRRPDAATEAGSSGDSGGAESGASDAASSGD